MTDKKPNQLSLFQQVNDLEHWNEIRRVELNGEMFYSVLDIFKFYGDTTNYRQEWKTTLGQLEKQGFSYSTEIIQYQFEGSDGRRKAATPIANLEVFLRIAQATSFKHWEDIRRFMSGAAAEKLQSQAERKRRNIIEKHEKAGYGDAPEIQRLRARDENIRVYKDLKTVIGQIVDNPNWASITNAEYTALFGMVSKQLKTLLNSESIRDSIGSHQLHALTYAEAVLRDLLKAQGETSNERILETIKFAIEPIGHHLQSVSDALGVHPVTGKPLLK